jgi:Rrf2 family nitric oxide-sensitive transcriptional repressor
MQLTQFSDIGLRLLMYLAHEQRESPAITLAEVSNQFAIPRNHLAKVAGKLTKHGWIASIRGRTGGMSLAMDASNLNIGQVLRVLEGHTEVIDCEKLACRLKNGCELKLALAQAYAAFFNVLDQHTLADVTNGLAAKEIVSMHKGFMEIYLDKSTIH